MWCPSYCCRSQSGHQSPLANCSTHTLPPLLPCTLCSAFSQPHGAHCAVSWGPSGWGPAGIQLMETTDRESWHIPDLYRCGVEVWVRHACNQSTSDSRLRHSLPHLPLLLLSSHFYFFFFSEHAFLFSFLPSCCCLYPLHNQSCGAWSEQVEHASMWWATAYPCVAEEKEGKYTYSPSCTRNIILTYPMRNKINLRCYIVVLHRNARGHFWQELLYISEVFFHV